MTQAPLRTNRSVSRVRKKKEKGGGRSGKTAQAIISADARRLQKRVGVLAERGDELRAEKVRRIKEQVAQGQYHIKAAEVAKGILRREIARLLGGRRKNNK